MELSNAAAQCYALAGRLRNAGLMRSDVADALAARGDDAAAAALYERQARLFLAEAWHQLAGLMLRKLARTQQVSAHGLQLDTWHVCCNQRARWHLVCILHLRQMAEHAARRGMAHVKCKRPAVLHLILTIRSEMTAAAELAEPDGHLRGAAVPAGAAAASGPRCDPAGLCRSSRVCVRQPGHPVAAPCVSQTPLSVYRFV